MSTSIARLVAPQLPSLRLFARALTGSQERGDGYVVATLEALVGEPELYRRDLPAKSAAYRAFLQIWGAMPLNQQTDTSDQSHSIADRRLETLTPRPRQAFLLAALENFTPAEIAQILDTSEAEARSLIDTAGREIAAQIAARLLIIEDEPLIGLDLEAIVTEIGHSVVGIAATRDEAVAAARKLEPALILADVQLADGSSGIDAVNDILADIKVPVIFITAYPERLLTGERAEPAFLITKPFRPEMVKAVISQALFFDIRAGRSRDEVAA